MIDRENRAAWAAVYRQAEATLLAARALDEACARGAPGTEIDAAVHEERTAERALGQLLVDLGVDQPGYLPPLRGSDGQRLLIDVVLGSSGGPDARVWVLAEDIDLRQAHQTAPSRAGVVVTAHGLPEPAPED